MDTQEEGALQREQDIEALIRRLPGLSTERCPCPMCMWPELYSTASRSSRRSNLSMLMTG